MALLVERRGTVVVLCKQRPLSFLKPRLDFLILRLARQGPLVGLSETGLRFILEPFQGQRFRRSKKFQPGLEDPP